MTQSKTKALKEALNALVLNFNQVRIERSIGVLKGGPNTSYPCARGAQYNLITTLGHEGGKQRKQKNLTTTWKQHGWLPFPFVSRIKGLHGRL